MRRASLRARPARWGMLSGTSYGPLDRVPRTMAMAKPS